jgi:uncharacterized protein YbjQ (UPF0145 family)
MVLTTTNSIEGHKIDDYLGIVTGIEVKRGYEKMSFSDSFKMKKYVEQMETQISKTKEEAFQKLQNNAQKLGANAVVGITVDVEVTSQLKVVISVVGTAVKVNSD